MPSTSASKLSVSSPFRMPLRSSSSSLATAAIGASSSTLDASAAATTTGSRKRKAEDELEKPSPPSPEAPLLSKSVSNNGTDASSSSKSEITMHQLTKPEWFEKYRLGNLEAAEVFYRPSWVDSETANVWLKELDALPQWYRPNLTVYGRTIRQSRHIAAFSTSCGLELKYSGHPVEMHSPFPPLLQEIADRLSSETCLGKEVGFNHCMLNRYETGEVYIGKHSDNLENKVIVTVSLGAARTFILERKKPRKPPHRSSIKSSSNPAATSPIKGLKKHDDTDTRKAASASAATDGIKEKILLGNGSLLVMQGETQKNYTHEIPKERKIKEPRISITFRQLIY